MKPLIEIFYPQMNEVKQYRLKAGLTQAELAERLKISRQSVVNWEQGKCPDHVIELFKMVLENNTCT